jgi:hypothetical protein
MPGLIFGISWQVNLSVFSDDGTVRRDQDGGVIMTFLAVFNSQFGITQVKANAQASGFVKKRLGGFVGHFGFKIGIYFRRVFHIPMGEECG